METLIKDHWNLDIHHSNKSEDRYETEFLINSIHSSIKDNQINTEEGISESEEFKNLIINMPEIIKKTIPRYRNFIINSQNWLGSVLEVKKETFFAKLEDKNDDTTYEIAEFDIEDVSKGDIELLKEGALFYWSVGYENYNGQVSKRSFIRFRRAIDIDVSDFDNIADYAKELNNDLSWD